PDITGALRGDPRGRGARHGAGAGHDERDPRSPGDTEIVMVSAACYLPEQRRRDGRGGTNRCAGPHFVDGQVASCIYRDWIDCIGGWRRPCPARSPPASSLSCLVRRVFCKRSRVATRKRPRNCGSATCQGVWRSVPPCGTTRPDGG